MKKIVINACFGGFDLSHAAYMAYANRKGFRLYPMRTKRDASGRLTFGEMEHVPDSEVRSTFCILYYKSPQANDEDHFWAEELPRDDPDLVAVVEMLGTAASGECSRLVVEELEPGTQYRIHEYDGYESIETRDGIDWSIA